MPGFLPEDLNTTASCSGSNEGEILYALVPDPAGVHGALITPPPSSSTPPRARP